ncbi:MAG: LacI family DNA-binding transcriptional regulator [Burkholderiaceae bacterium]
MAARPRAAGSAGSTVTTSHDVARLAQVSQATVSRVLRDDPKVRRETRERVLKVLAETRYEPNAAARAFRAGRADSIGVVVARLSYQLYPAMLEAIGAQLARLGLRMIVWDSDHGGDAPAIRALRQGVVDGVILTAATGESEFLREVPALRAAVVLLNRVVIEYGGDQVESDNLDGGRRVADYLVACGRQRIALVGGIPRASTIRNREQGFREALARRGVQLWPHYCFRSDTFSHASGVQAAQRLMELASPPDAIFCVNDVLAMGVIDGVRARGVRVPEDVWVVGYDDIELASWGAYDLTTVRQPMEQMVAQAIELLLARIADRDRPVVRRCLANELVIRSSTARAQPPAQRRTKR